MVTVKICLLRVDVVKNYNEDRMWELDDILMMLQVKDLIK